MSKDDFFKDEDPLEEIDELTTHFLGINWDNIEDQLTRITTPKDDKWTYYNEFEKAKKTEDIENVDYEKLSEEFTKSSNKVLTDKEKFDIINKIVWSED